MLYDQLKSIPSNHEGGSENISWKRPLQKLSLHHTTCLLTRRQNLWSKASGCFTPSSSSWYNSSLMPYWLIHVARHYIMQQDFSQSLRSFAKTVYSSSFHVYCAFLCNMIVSGTAIFEFSLIKCRYTLKTPATSWLNSHFVEIPSMAFFLREGITSTFETLCPKNSTSIQKNSHFFTFNMSSTSCTFIRASLNVPSMPQYHPDIWHICSIQYQLQSAPSTSWK